MVETPEGARYRLADGREFTSPSAAGSAVMGGVSCNGWRFWSVQSALDAAPVAVPTTAVRSVPSRRQKVFGQIKRIANQNGIPDGHVRWFCSACQKGFLVEGATIPDTCPAGHPRLPVETAVETAVVPPTDPEAAP